MGEDRPAHVCLPLVAINTPSLMQSALETNGYAHEDPSTQLPATAAGGPHHIHTASMAWRVAALSRGLSLPAGLGLRPGQVVMLAALNSGPMLEALLAICDTGAIASPINHRWGTAELAAAMQLTQPTAVLVDAACWGLVQQALGKQSPRVQAAMQPRIILLGDRSLLAGRKGEEAGWEGSGCGAWDQAAPHVNAERLIRIGKQAWAHPTGKVAAAHTQGTAAAAAGLGPHAVAAPGAPPLQLRAPTDGSAVICFTSGTTGRPKGVVLSHAAIHSQSLAKLATIGYAHTDIYLHLAPLFHVGGLSSAHAALMAGCAQVVLPRFDASSALQIMHTQKVTAFIAVPAMMQDLVATYAKARASCSPSFPPYSPSSSPSSSPSFPPSDNVLATPVQSVQKILMGAGATSPKLLAATAALFPCAHIMSAYGMTETASSITFITLRRPHSTCPEHLGAQQQMGAHQGSCPHSTSTLQHTVHGRHVRSLHGLHASPQDPIPHAAQHQHIRQQDQQQQHQHQHQQQQQLEHEHQHQHHPHLRGVTVHLGALPPPGAPAAREAAGPHFDPAAAVGATALLPTRPGAVCVGWPAPGVWVHIEPLERGHGPPPGCGVGAPGCQATEQGSAQQPGGEQVLLGEVCVRGTCVMDRYWHAPLETEQAFLPGGHSERWLRTGDLGFIDGGGALWLQGRAKDMIKSGGENVHAAEVEAALCQHPGVATAAVFGVPDVRMGETVAAAVVLQPGWEWQGLVLGHIPSTLVQEEQQQQQQQQAQAQVLTADKLRAFCRTGSMNGVGTESLLSPYKLPRLLASTWPLGSPLPCNASGKLLKGQVREAMLVMQGLHTGRDDQAGLGSAGLHGKLNRL